MKLFLALTLAAATAFGADKTHWVVTWAASPSQQIPEAEQMRTRKLEFSNQTVREIVHASIGGDTVRINTETGEYASRV